MKKQVINQLVLELAEGQGTRSSARKELHRVLDVEGGSRARAADDAVATSSASAAARCCRSFDRRADHGAVRCVLRRSARTAGERLDGDIPVDGTGAGIGTRRVIAAVDIGARTRRVITGTDIGAGNHDGPRGGPAGRAGP